MYEYIPDEFGRAWVASQDAAKRGYFTPLAFIDILGGDRYTAEIFSQIMYWHLPNDEGKPRMSLIKDGVLWVAKNYRDWFDETRIVAATARKAIEILVEQKLIFKSTEGFAGQKTPWLRINWPEFRRRMTLWLRKNEEALRPFAGKAVKDTDYKKAVAFYCEVPTPVITAQWSDTPEHPSDTTGQSPLLRGNVPYTESESRFNIYPSVATGVASANLFMQTMVNLIGKVLESQSPPAKPAKSKEESPRWTKEQRDSLFNVIAHHSFDIPDPTQISDERTGAAGRIGKILSLLQRRAPSLTEKELEAFYLDYRDEEDNLAYPRDAEKFDTAFTAWWQKRQIRLLESKKPRKARPVGVRPVDAVEGAANA